MPLVSHVVVTPLDAIEERASSRKLGNLKAALRYLAPYRWYVIGASIALIVTASVTLSIGQGVRMVIDAGFTSGAPGMLEHSLEIFALLVALLTLGTYARFYLVSWVGERVSADLRQAVFDHLVHLHPGFFEENLPTEIQSRVTTDTTLLQTVIGSSVSIALRNLLMFVGGVVLLVASNPKLSLVVLASAPVVVAPIVLFGRRVRSLSRSSQDELARVGSYVGEAFRHIKVVQAFNHQERDIQAFGEYVDSAFDVAVRRIRQRAWLVALVMMLVLSAIAMMLWIGGQDVIAGRTSAGELAAFIFYAFIVAGSVGSISEVVSDLQRAAGATERLVELLSARSPLIDPADPVVLDAQGPASLAFRKCRLRVSDPPDGAGVEAGVVPGRCRRNRRVGRARRAPARRRCSIWRSAFTTPMRGQSHRWCRHSPLFAARPAQPDRLRAAGPGAVRRQRARQPALWRAGCRRGRGARGVGVGGRADVRRWISRRPRNADRRRRRWSCPADSASVLRSRAR